MKKYSTTADIASSSKNKAAPFGMVGGIVYVNDGTNTRPISGFSTPVASGGSARTLLASDSGTTNLFDSASGITYTLPAPSAGLVFNFLWTVLQTTSAHVVVTNAASVFLLGYVTTFSDVNITPSATLGPKGFAGDGTTHIKTTTNATTTGGGVGSWLQFKCLSATQWAVTGTIRSPSGSIATPFST
jgi:hypothetical protein